MVDSTIEIYNQIRTQLLPTPSKPHYTFNLRDVARVIQGVMRADPKTTTEPDQLTTLWLHEASRVFADRLVNAEDAAWFRQASSPYACPCALLHVCFFFKGQQSPCDADASFGRQCHEPYVCLEQAPHCMQPKQSHSWSGQDLHLSLHNVDLS